MLRGARGWVLGDRNYWDPELFRQLLQQGIYLLAPFKSAKRQKFRWPLRFSHMRYRIDTVFGQLVERFQAKRNWARDAWHLTSRWLRKVFEPYRCGMVLSTRGSPATPFCRFAF